MKKQKFTLADLRVGSIVTFKAGGKVARSEDMSGKIVRATVTEIRERGAVRADVPDISVMCDYRTLSGAKYQGMGSVVMLTSILTVEQY